MRVRLRRCGNESPKVEPPLTDIRMVTVLAALFQPPGEGFGMQNAFLTGETDPTLTIFNHQFDSHPDRKKTAFIQGDS
jgi:hypothetical protein